MDPYWSSRVNDKACGSERVSRQRRQRRRRKKERKCFEGTQALTETERQSA